MENRRQVALDCLKIEKLGLSVLDFLQELGAVSPWGTWWRLQVEELGRERYQIRDGKGVIDMKKLTLENKKKAVEIALEGGNPLDYLKECGAANPSASWVYIRKCLQAKSPEKYDQLMQIQKPEKKTEPEPIKDPLAGFEPFDPKKEETVTFQGKEYERAEKSSPTCCQPARPSGVTVPEDLPEEKPQKSKLKIKEADGAVGTWRVRAYEGTISFKMPAQRESEDDQEIELSAEEWMILAEELPNVLQLFGLSKRGGAGQ